MIRLRRQRSSRRTETMPVRTVVVRGAITTAILVVFGYLSTTLFSGVPGRNYVNVTAEVPNVGNLLPHDPVRVNGVRVGQVLNTYVGPTGLGRIKIQLEPGTELAADSGILIRANGLLGGRSVELVPGRSARPLDDGALIKGGSRSLTFGVPELLEVFDRPTRDGLGRSVRGLGAGLLGRGTQLNQMLETMGNDIRPFRKLPRAILAREGAAEALLPSVRSAMTTLSAHREQLAALFSPASGAMRPFADERPAVQKTLDNAPPALSSARAGLGEGVRLLSAARVLASELRVALPPAPSGLRAAASMLRSAPVPLRRGRSLLHAAKQAVPQALALTRAANPLFTPLRRTLEPAASMLKYLGPYGCDFENFGVVLRSMTGFGGYGEGPHGSPGQFRLQPVIPVSAAQLGAADPLVRRDSYSAPCTYPSKPYSNVNIRPGAGR